MYRLLIYDGSDWVELFDASFNGLSIKRFGDEDSIRVRDKAEGSVTITKDSYDYLLPLKPTYSINSRIYKGSDLLIETPLMLDGEWFYRSKKCILGFQQEDDYSEVLSNIDNEVVYDQGIPTENVTMAVKISNRRMFQVRVVRPFEQDNNPLVTNSWANCQTLNWTDVNVWSPSKQYEKYDVFLPDDIEGSSNDAYMCDIDNVSNVFVWFADPISLRLHYYCAKRPNNGKTPAIGIDNDDWIWLCDSAHILVGLRPHEMGQNYAPIMFDGSFYNETDKNWVKGGCTASDSIMNVSAPALFWFLEDLLNKADPTITVDFATFLPYVDTIDSQFKNLLNYQLWYDEDGQALNLEQTFKLSDIINIYRKIFKVDWRLENKNFVFRHKSEIPAQPTNYATNPNQYIDRNLSKDWSNEHFNTLIDAAIQKEKFSIGTSEDPYFGTQIIDYENSNTEIIDDNDTSFELDITNIFKTPYKNDKVIIIQYDDDGTVPVYLKALTGWVYNARMALFDLIQIFYTYDRPFAAGKLISMYNNDLYRNLIFTRKAVEETVINIPYNDQRMLDFDLLLKSTFGDLQIKEFSVNLNTANAQITAVK